MYDIQLLKNISRTRTSHYRDDLDEVYLLARATPSLTTHLPELQEVINWFDRVFTGNLRHHELTAYWFDFMNMVLQRYAVIFSAELTAADNLVRNFFTRFFHNTLLKNIHVSYRENVTPLVFLGRGGSKSYYTLPPSVHRPLAIIHLPRAALNNVWRWTVLAHETGHDVFYSVEGLAEEMDLVTVSAVNGVCSSGAVNLTPVSAVPYANRPPAEMELSGGQFAVTLWSRWVNELFADTFAILMCGPASVLTMQEMIGFASVGNWHGMHGPDHHPVPLLRNLTNILILRLLGFADESQKLEQRMNVYTKLPPEIAWYGDGAQAEMARAQLTDMLHIAEAVADAMLHTRLQSLNNHSLREIIDFNAGDQGRVLALTQAITGAGPVYPGSEPRHLAAAAQTAFVNQPYLGDVIHNTVLNMLAG